MRSLLQCLIILLLTIFLSQCVVHEARPVKKSPPPWAPAHGVRAKHKYRYYPSAYVYYDIHRKQYFYLDNGGWLMAATLPAGIYLGTGDYVVIELDTDKPYTHFKKHKEKYPGKKPKKHKHKNKKW